MKKILCLTVILLAAMAGGALAQNVGIGTATPQQKLHVAGGLRVDTLANGTDSGLVRHNALGTVYSLKFTGDSTQMLRGNGSFGPSGFGTNWNLTGNTGTNPATSFIGTTDNNPLLFRINGQFAGKLDSVSATSLFGYGAGKNISTGAFNTAIGTKALNATTTGSQNTALGGQAMQSNTTGINNTAVGLNSANVNTSGSGNVAVGVQALNWNTTGNTNTALGAGSLFSNTTGFSNVGIGIYALAANSTGYNLVAVGDSALYSLNGGNGYNTAVGSKTLYATTTGYQNAAFGSWAANWNTTGSQNTAAGHAAMIYNTTGSQNVALGYFALLNNKTGSYHVAVGANALVNTTASYPNTGVGTNAGYNISTGTANTVMGAYAMQNATTGINNTGVGNACLSTLTTGSDVTAIGNSADVSSGTLTNATAIGAEAVVNASNKVRIGNSAVTVIEGQVNFTTPSDGRYKFNIREDVKGLDFILRLRPVTYQFDVRRFDQAIQASYHPPAASYDEALALRRTGFIAQEVEKAAQVSGYDFSGINRPKTEQDHYSLSYESFVVPLVKAVQEQQKTIETLNEKIARQQQQIDELLRRLPAANGNIQKN